ncbi:hypothetical protein [Xanthomonas oryzae]|uniref:hypothetical protein n=1 Tax=Xanthomonas oryzae TaxID=347 RepID=UPI0010345E95|nr:hypothetical protein [Xanthomonas oryzae]QBH01339.1 hypothetical protein EYC56_21330 [Xanthomonas oryzae]
MGASTVWRKTFSILSIVVGIWMIVIWRWRQTNYLPSATDLTVYGLGLPTTALIGIGVLRAAFSRVPSASASVVPEPAPVATGAANSTEQHPAEAMTALVLDSALQLPAGRSVDDIMVSVRKGIWSDCMDPCAASMAPIYSLRPFPHSNPSASFPTRWILKKNRSEPCCLPRTWWMS